MHNAAQGALVRRHALRILRALPTCVRPMLERDAPSSTRQLTIDAPNILRQRLAQVIGAFGGLGWRWHCHVRIRHCLAGSSVGGGLFPRVVGMPKLILTALRVLGQNALRLLLICAGAWLAAVEPADYWAEARRAANAASGHVPNMDPGVVVVLAMIAALPILVALLLGEMTRCIAGGKALSLPSCLALGALAASPVGYAYGFDSSISDTVMYLATAFLLTSFYSARWAWLTRRARRPTAMPGLGRGEP